MLFLSLLFYDERVKKILLISLLFIVPLISPQIAQADVKACSATIKPDPVTTNDIAIDVSIKPQRDGDLLDGNQYLIMINEYWVGQLAGPLAPDVRGEPDKFTYTSGTGIAIKGLSPEGYPNTKFDQRVRTTTFESKQYVLSVYTDNGNTQVCQTSGFTPKQVAGADQCTISLSRVPSNATPAPTSSLSCQQLCERNYDPDSNAAAACLQNCQTATPTPSPNTITSDADIYIKVNNLAHQGLLEREGLGGQERYRLVIKRDNDQGASIPRITDPKRRYDELTSGNLNLGRLEQGTYDLEVRNFVEGSILERNYCKYNFRVGYPGETGGGIEDTFAKENFLNPFCKLTNKNEQKYICDTAIGEIEANLPALVKKLFAVLLSLSGGIAVLLIIVAGYQLITSSGNPEKTQAARERLTSAVVGLLFIIFSFVILEVIGVSILRIPGIG